ncbi:3-hydroxyacyl-CoA dehydrogenase NAD-binding domain-containing protein [Achromobacter anxifer]|uniref:3-hydroxyacyl-CoA dehydrogenase NAD-binding domain-containing protein n=1 Tax=Achromobacter anxifer TaxID=1287737 RepID=UPI0021585EB0|nr:3-hydroxyacyl-CoA dehydrogenase NAD-binding domain-containing protein [Achromobacter anxifer]
MQAVSSTLSGNIRVILIDNPPVNATSQAVRAGLLQAMEQAGADGATQAIVIACAGATFVAGADIKEFGKPPVDPHLSDVIHAIESSDKPVVAAIHGLALGGGLELALGCHYRVVDAQARLGLPESTLGIIPGAGGIPRLLRLAGVEKALDMAAGGKPIDAVQALEAGVADALAQEDVRGAAMAYAQRLLEQGRGARRTRELPAPACDPATFDAARDRFRASHRGQLAPQACVDVAARSVSADFDAAVTYGRERFRELVASPQARALRHAFFAERVATKPAGLPMEEAKPVRKAGVVGAGTMGTGIAMCFLNAGIPVVLVEQNEKVLASSVETIGKTYRNDVAKGRITADTQRARGEALMPTLQYESLHDCDLVVEAVFEDMGVKQQVLASIEENLRLDALIATNTSFLDIDALAAGLRRPENVVGMHFFSPAHIMKLLENVRGKRSAPRALATAQALGKRLGKVAVMVGVSDGFVGNRMLARRTRECYFMLEEGALPEQVDRVLCEFGFPMGQFQLNDLAGLDVAWRNRQSRLDRLSEREVACNILDEIVAAGRLGQKTGAGFYTYDAQRRRSVDPAISELIVRNAERRGIARRVISDEEILERCLYSMINEGARILEEGVASRPEDIDTIWLNGYGFPRFRGGPMFHADQIGAARICERIRHYASHAGAQYWTPAPLLLAQARDGGAFHGR